MNSSDQQPAIIINSVARLLSKKNPQSKQGPDDFVVEDSYPGSPLLSDIELEDSQILWLLLLALSIANQLDRETLFRKKLYKYLKIKNIHIANSTFGLDSSTDNFLLQNKSTDCG